MKFDRLIELEGGVNFRDFGGLGTVRGARLRKGLLFRSGTLARLTERDLGIVTELGISRIFDLRLASERSAEPSILSGRDVQVFTFPDMHAAVGDRLREALTAADTGPDHILVPDIQGR